MASKDRKGTIVNTSLEGQDKATAFLYENPFGRLLLKLLIKPAISKIAGAFLNTSISRLWIKGFVRNNHINMRQYEKRKFKSYNDFFTRKLAPGAREIDMELNSLISPCDSKLTVYNIDENSRFNIKGGQYTLESLLQDEELAEEFQGGQLLLFRLAVDDYHRYCFFDGGKAEKLKYIQGCLHTVNPMVLDKVQVYKENCREITVFNSKAFGKSLYIEVGAMMVGKIVNDYEDNIVSKGQEKGHFDFGGSTVIVVLKANSAQIDEDILQNSSEGYETIVKYGEKIGKKLAN